MVYGGHASTYPRQFAPRSINPETRLMPIAVLQSKTVPRGSVALTFPDLAGLLAQRIVCVMRSGSARFAPRVQTAQSSLRWRCTADRSLKISQALLTSWCVGKCCFR